MENFNYYIDDKKELHMIQQQNDFCFNGCKKRLGHYGYVLAFS